MKHILLLIFSTSLILSVSVLAHSALEDDCYANDEDPYLLFATKTSYFTVENQESTPIEVEGIYVYIFLKNP